MEFERKCLCLLNLSWNILLCIQLLEFEKKIFNCQNLSESVLFDRIWSERIHPSEFILYYFGRNNFSDT